MTGSFAVGLVAGLVGAVIGTIGGVAVGASLATRELRTANHRRPRDDA